MTFLIWKRRLARKKKKWIQAAGLRTECVCVFDFSHRQIMTQLKICLQQRKKRIDRTRDWKIHACTQWEYCACWEEQSTCYDMVCWYIKLWIDFWYQAVPSSQAIANCVSTLGFTFVSPISVWHLFWKKNPIPYSFPFLLYHLQFALSIYWKYEIFLIHSREQRLITMNRSRRERERKIYQKHFESICSYLILDHRMMVLHNKLSRSRMF